MSGRRPRGRPWSGRIGRYRLADKLGSGAFGTVWRAWDPSAKDWVAIKVFSGRGGEEGAWRFLREQRLDIEHPSIVEVLDFASDSAGSYLVTELLPHGTLEDYITERGALAPDLVITWGAHLLDAVAAIAAAGVVHRDIKPSNVMLRDEPDGPRAVLVDFGQAWVDDGAELTSGQGPVGTSGYIAPEYADPMAPPTPAGDVYAVGVTLRRALTGGDRSVPASPDEFMHRLAGPVPQANDESQALLALPPVDLIDLLDRLCDPDPRQRPRASDAAEALQVLGAERRAAGRAPTGRAGLPPRVGSPPDPYRRRKIGAGLTFAVLANATAFWAITRPGPPPPPEAARSSEIAWTTPDGPIAVADDGTVYSASVERGIVYRHDGADLVPVAGGGTDEDGRGSAREVDLSSALRLGGSSFQTWDTYVPMTWTLAVGPDGELWLNTGELWRIEPGGEARRVIAVDPSPDAEPEVTPYVVFTKNLTDEPVPDDPGIFDPRLSIESQASPIVARGDGVDVWDSEGERIVHVDAKGGNTVACDLERAERAGIVPDGVTPKDVPLQPASFAVLEEGDCWVVDSATGEVAHVVDGQAVATFYSQVNDSGSNEERPWWTRERTAPDHVGIDPRTTIVGLAPDDELVVYRGGGTATVGVVPSGGSFPERTSSFVEVDALMPDGRIGTSGPTSLAVSVDGHHLVGLFDRLSAPFQSDPRLVVPATSLAVFDLAALLEQLGTADDALLLPDAVLDVGSQGGERLATYDVASTLAESRPVTVDPSVGDRTDVVASAFSTARVGATDTHFVASLDGQPWIWRFAPRPDDRLTITAAVGTSPETGDVGGDDAGDTGEGTCRVDDLALAPSGRSAAVLCRSEGDGKRSVFGVDLTGPTDDAPRVLASPAAFDRAAKEWADANESEAAGLGPGLRLVYHPDGRLLLAAEDEGTVYEVRGRPDAALRPLNDLAFEPTAVAKRVEERLTDIDDDPVLVAAALRDVWSDIDGDADDPCRNPVDQRGSYAWRDFAAVGTADDPQLVISTSRCLLRVDPGTGTEPFAPEQRSARLTLLAGSPDGLLAYDPVDATIWRYPIDGGDRVLVAGRSGRFATTPDGQRAAGSPIGTVLNLLWGPDDEPCFVEFEARAIRCVDERGALRTRAGPPVRLP